MNLLPDKQKKKINSLKRWNSVFVFSVFLLSFSVFSLFTLYFVRNYSIAYLENESDLIEMREVEFTDVGKARKEIEEANRMITQAESIHQEFGKASALLKQMEEIFYPDVEIKSFEFNKENSSTVILTGQASNWEVLNDAEEELEERFFAVEIFPETWTDLENINFSVNFQLE